MRPSFYLIGGSVFPRRDLRRVSKRWTDGPSAGETCSLSSPKVISPFPGIHSFGLNPTSLTTSQKARSNMPAA